MNFWLNEYFQFSFELNHFWARFNVWLNNRNVSARAIWIRSSDDAHNISTLSSVEDGECLLHSFQSHAGLFMIFQPNPPWKGNSFTNISPALPFGTAKYVFFLKTKTFHQYFPSSAFWYCTIGVPLLHILGFFNQIHHLQYISPALPFGTAQLVFLCGLWENNNSPSPSLFYSWSLAQCDVQQTKNKGKK